MCFWGPRKGSHLTQVVFKPGGLRDRFDCILWGYMTRTSRNAKDGEQPLRHFLLTCSRINCVLLFWSLWKWQHYLQYTYKDITFTPSVVRDQHELIYYLILTHKLSFISPLSETTLGQDLCQMGTPWHKSWKRHNVTLTSLFLYWCCTDSERKIKQPSIFPFNSKGMIFVVCQCNLYGKDITCA